MILLRKLQLNNFLSYEETELSFVDGEKALIDGASGAGKSALFDSILWCLYGQGRADNRSLVRKGAKKGSVCLELTSQRRELPEDENIIITRSITTNGKHILEVAFEQPDGSRKPLPVSGLKELQAWIDKDLIGASYLLFVNSVAYVQGNADSFVAQTAPKRKELLLEIVKAEDYGKYYEQARKSLVELGNAQNLALGQIGELESRLDSLKANLGDRGALLKVINDNTEILMKLEPIIINLENKKALFMSADKTIGVLEDNLKSAQFDVESTKNVINARLVQISDKTQNLWITYDSREFSYTTKATQKDIDLMLSKAKEKLASAAADMAILNEYNARKPVVADYSQEIDRLALQMKTLQEKPPCPAGDKCPYYPMVLNDQVGVTNEMERLKDLDTSQVVALARWASEGGNIPKAVDVEALVKEIGSMEAYLKNLEIESQIKLLQEDLKNKISRVQDIIQKKESAEAAAGKEEITKISAELTARNQDKDASKEAITRATTTLEGIDTTEAEMKAVGERLNTLKGPGMKTIIEKMRKVTLVKNAFGPKGIETMVIDYILPKLEDRINDVLAKLSDFRVRLDTQRKSADGENVIEGLFITILNEMNEEMPFESYSGGEKLKISVAVSEALATLQHVGFRLFDETFIGLDENSTESFAQVLTDLQKNFSQVFCISHLLQIKELFDKKLFVTKNNNISYVAT
jgi:DNA repair exonuclease SbcCD ATPase subunit